LPKQSFAGNRKKIIKDKINKGLLNKFNQQLNIEKVFKRYISDEIA